MAGNGFRPIGVLGSAYPVQTSEYAIASAYGTDIYEGDPVCMAATGCIIKGTLTLINNADMVGVFMGCSYTDAQGARQWSNYYPATQTVSGTIAYVADNPLTKFKVKITTSGADATMTQADVGFNADIDVTNEGSATTGYGAYSLETVGATAGTANFRIVGLTNDVNGPIDSQSWTATTFTHAIVIVQPDLHFHNQGAGI